MASNGDHYTASSMPIQYYRDVSTFMKWLNSRTCEIRTEYGRASHPLRACSIRSGLVVNRAQLLGNELGARFGIVLLLML